MPYFGSEGVRPADTVVLLLGVWQRSMVEENTRSVVSLVRVRVRLVRVRVRVRVRVSTITTHI